ncbi:ewing's tumor-associated antigen 1 homolog [Nematolebias whitei]|uniref:ewing's tumor-associated antigen 1 homolog n=1 Tax=Nematolebias whitei TaxID=451745 RepID=UPI0018979A51|nr:ewing's tumor-associated antigen 1 homolog [Nematolebias whitei]
MSGFVQNLKFSKLWSNLVFTLDLNKTQQGSSTGQQMPGTTTSPACNDLLSPRLRGSSRHPELNVGVSPGDVEASQDIVWDSTSPTQNRWRLKNTNDVEISDIVNRIAPKNINPKGSESSLSRWIVDGTILSPPVNSNQNGRKKSSRQSNVEDLWKLAKQFDENMQQDEETSEQLNSVTTDHCKSVNTYETKPTTSSVLSHVKNLKCSSSSDQAEAELHALFDCSTQGVSGRLSEGSVCSQEMVDQPVSEGFAKHQQTELKPADKSGTAEQKETCSLSTKNRIEFYDDWESDDLLNDPFILAITQNPNGLDANPDTTLKSHTQTNSKLSVLNSDAVQSLQELCPKPKLSNRSTFRLEPNPHFPSKMNKDVSKTSFTVIQPKSKMTVKNSAVPKTRPAVQPNSITTEVGAPSVKDISDSLWDSGDDELLYQVCDSLEKISNCHPKEVNPSKCREHQEVAVGGQLKTTEVLPTNTTGSVLSGASANNRRSSGTFLRSNSLPGTSCNASHQGWNIPMNGTNSKSGMSQSFPKSRVGQDTFNLCSNFSGNFQAGNGNMDTKLQTMTTRGPHISKSHHTAFKRNMSDSAVIRNKVFVSSQTTGKCSAAEIEKKKQEALARRRLRMQNTSKP